MDEHGQARTNTLECPSCRTPMREVAIHLVTDEPEVWWLARLCSCRGDPMQKVDVGGYQATMPERPWKPGEEKGL